MGKRFKRCHTCGQSYTGWRCPCRKKGGTASAGQRRGRASAGCGTRGWSYALAQSRILGGWERSDNASAEDEEHDADES